MTRGLALGTIFWVWASEVGPSLLPHPVTGVAGSSQGPDMRACSPGSQGQQVVSEELHDVVGQTLSVRCQYSPEGGSYRQKTWCRQTSPNLCTRLVTSSAPRTVTQDSRYAIWDVPDAGFFNISMAQLTENDSGPYWCGPYNSSRNTITVLRNISLLVSPGKLLS